MKSCSTNECRREYFVNGLCKLHYHRAWKSKTLPLRSSINQRFWLKVNKTNYCWEWVASKSWSGYGLFRVGDKKVTAHRYSYELYKGKIPSGLQLDHLCRNRACVNPEHLEPVTNRENVVRGKIVTDKKSGLPVGVRKTAHNKYQAQKKFSGVKVHLGNYITPDEASIVYQTAVLGDSL